jgi:hypothetical protein
MILDVHGSMLRRARDHIPSTTSRVESRPAARRRRSTCSVKARKRWGCARIKSLVQVIPHSRNASSVCCSERRIASNACSKCADQTGASGGMLRVIRCSLRSASRYKSHINNDHGNFRQYVYEGCMTINACCCGAALPAICRSSNGMRASQSSAPGVSSAGVATIRGCPCQAARANCILDWVAGRFHMRLTSGPSGEVICVEPRGASSRPRNSESPCPATAYLLVCFCFACFACGSICGACLLQGLRTRATGSLSCK